MNNDGYILLPKSFIKWQWFKDADVLGVFIHLLLMAAPHPKKVSGVMLQRGQCLADIANYSVLLGLSSQQVETALGKLVITGEIDVQSVNEYAIITVRDFDKYCDE